MSPVSTLHYELVQGLLHHGACPTIQALSTKLHLPEAEVETLLRDLAAIHGVVLHPHACEPWIVHPFSLTPTLNYITSEFGPSWWAPCVWCALGVATLAGGSTRIHTRLGAEAEPLVIDVLDGRPLLQDLWVHFAIPPVRAWDNVHQHCALVLPFRSPADIEHWCARHQVPMGEAVPLHTVADLARVWYGAHANPDWHKWTVKEAQQIFTRVGLTSNFWTLPGSSAVFGAALT